MFSQNPFFSSCTSWVAAGSCYVLVALKHLGLGYQLSLKVILGQSMSVLAVWVRQSRWPSASNPNHSDEFKHIDSHDLQSHVLHHHLWNHPIRFDLIHSDLIQLAPIQTIHVFRIGIHHREYKKNGKCHEMENEMCSEWAICEAPIMHYGRVLWLWKIMDITSDWIIHWNESCIDCYWKRKRGKRVFERDWNGWRWRNG